MVVTILLVLLGIPAIAALTLMAVRRARALARRIEDVQAEMARNPQAPYTALATLMQERDRDSRRASRVWPPAPRAPRRGKDGPSHG